MAEASRRKKIVAYSLCGLAAVAVAYRVTIGHSDPIDEVPDDPELKSPWACESCGQVYELTPREEVEFQQRGMQSTRGAPEVDAKGVTEVTSVRQLRMLCPECNKPSLIRAAKCPECRTPFATMVNGLPAKCPKCGWDITRASAPGKARGD